MSDAIPGLVDYAVRLILSLAGGIPQGSPIDLYPLPKRPLPISLKLPRVARLLGEPVESNEVERNLRTVGFRIAPEAKDVLKVSPPSWRHDVRSDVDLAEEIARLRGYDSLIRAAAIPRQCGAGLAAGSRFRSAWLRHSSVPASTRYGPGLSSLMRRADCPGDESVGRGRSFLRGDLLTNSDITCARVHLARMQGHVRLFEIGTAFFAGEEPAPLPGPRKAALPREEMHVAALVMGQRTPTHFTRAVQPSYDEWDIKFLAERAAAAAFPNAAIEMVPSSGEVLWNITANGTAVGTARRLKLDAPVWAKPAFGVEINLEAREQVSATSKSYRAIPATPRVQVDLALLAPLAVTAAQIDAVIRKEAGELLESLTLFDEFVGQGIQKARAWSWR